MSSWTARCAGLSGRTAGASACATRSSTSPPRPAPSPTSPLASTAAARATIFAQYEAPRDDRVICSPHVFMADRSNYANPGVEVRWVNGGFGEGFPVIDADDPSIYEIILDRAADLASAAYGPR